MSVYLSVCLMPFIYSKWEICGELNSEDITSDTSNWRSNFDVNNEQKCKTFCANLLQEWSMKRFTSNQKPTKWSQSIL